MAHSETGETLLLTTEVVEDHVEDVEEGVGALEINNITTTKLGPKPDDIPLDSLRDESDLKGANSDLEAVNEIGLNLEESEVVEQHKNGHEPKEGDPEKNGDMKHEEIESADILGDTSRTDHLPVQSTSSSNSSELRTEDVEEPPPSRPPPQLANNNVIEDLQGLSQIKLSKKSNSNSIDLVDTRLFLGNAQNACDINLLNRNNITHILTIDSCPLPENITHLPHVQTKYVQVSDLPSSDLLNHFEECISFIEEAVNDDSGRSGSVLVHCYFGVSRSATIVLAYMMKKYSMCLEEAQKRLMEKRSIIGPNYGFLSQLKLFEIMNFRIDKTNLYYRRFRLRMAGDKVKSVKILPAPFRDIIKLDPYLNTVRPEPVVYRCKKCRRTLARQSDLLTHAEKKSPLWFEFDSGSSDPPSSICTQMLFFEPISWMPVTQCLQGKIYCPNENCKSKLGSFSWILGVQCPCGARVQPAFYLVPNKVDKSNSVLNVQITI